MTPFRFQTAQKNSAYASFFCTAVWKLNDVITMLCYWTMHVSLCFNCLLKIPLTLSGPAFSVVRQARGGSEAQMPKIKVNITRLKWNFAWIILTIKAFLMQNLSVVALLVLEIWRHKISFGRREWVIKFGYLPPENGFNLKKKSFYVQNRSSRPKIDPHVNFSNFQAEENLFIFKVFGTSWREKSSSNPLIHQFCLTLVRLCLEDKN